MRDEIVSVSLGGNGTSIREFRLAEAADRDTTTCRVRPVGGRFERRADQIGMSFDAETAAAILPRVAGLDSDG